MANQEKDIKPQKSAPKVCIVMGSDSDLAVMEAAAAVLNQFAIPYEMTVASAHRSPKRSADLASSAKARGIKVIIAGAGHAAHLAGAMGLPALGVFVRTDPARYLALGPHSSTIGEIGAMPEPQAVLEALEQLDARERTDA